ncbi:MAG: N5-glutamine methyltransferase family protein [Candidatus Paceibacteria bacterium]
MLADPVEDYERGFVPFLGVNVYLDSRPLIPRTETEYWVERAITEMCDVGRRTFRVLDMFAGSGCIGLAVLKQVPNARVTFVEKESRHFPTIEKSLRKNSIDQSRATLIQADVWTPLFDVRRQTVGVFDFVLANPPYVSRLRDTISPEVLAHEPREALFADDDGFAFIARFIEGLPRHLAAGGAAWVEHEPNHVSRIAKAAARPCLAAETHRDQYGAERFTKLTRKAVA